MPTSMFRSKLVFPIFLTLPLAACDPNEGRPVEDDASTGPADTTYGRGLDRHQAEWLSRIQARPAGR